MLRFNFGDIVTVKKDIHSKFGGKNGEIIEVHRDKEYAGYDYKVKLDDYELYFDDNELNLFQKKSSKSTSTATKVQPYSFEQIGSEIGQLVETKQKAYGDSFNQAFELMKVFLNKYRTVNGDYVISEDLLRHLLIQVRIIDKQNRIFSNPSGDLMGENGYADIIGYGILSYPIFDKKLN